MKRMPGVGWNDPSGYFVMTKAVVRTVQPPMRVELYLPTTFLPLFFTEALMNHFVDGSL